jgi:membrane-bound lytic murein transglycosylase D
MIVTTCRTIVACWLTSVLVGCAAPYHSSTSDGVPYHHATDHPPAAAYAPLIVNEAISPPEARSERKFPGKETQGVARAQPDSKEKQKNQKKDVPDKGVAASEEASGPADDDELFELGRREIDAAMEQSPGDRQLRLSLPLQKHHRVRHFVEGFSGTHKHFFGRALARSGRYVPMMAAILRQEELPESLVYLALIESGFSYYAYSRAHALGPWQFIHSTAVRYGLKIDPWVDERRDPVLSTRAAAAYLKDLHQRFGEWFLAAAAYNAGEGRVGGALQRSRTNDFWLLREEHKYLKLETRDYVPKFIAAALIASAPEKYGFEEIDYEPPLQYDEVMIDTPLRLQTVAGLANTDVNVIKELNPALLRNFTPPTDEGFKLRLPVGSGKAFAGAYKLLPASTRIKLSLHRVTKGETLLSIAKRYGQTASRLLKENALKSWRLRPGQELIIVRDGR